jgi:hypothetical protein
MALDNEKEVVLIIAKLFKSIDSTLVDYLANSSYNYISQLTDPHTVTTIIGANLSEQELNVLATALSDNEIEVNKLIVDHFNLDKFYKRIKDATTRPVVRGIMSAYGTLKENKRYQENMSRKQKENCELYKAARLTPRQKQVLTTLGIPLANYEKKKP